MRTLVKAGLTGLAGLVLLAAAAPLSAAQTFAVIVSEENAYAGEGAAAVQQLRRLYLREQTSWPGGQDAVAFAREPGSPEQTAFLATVVGMTQAEETAHWLRMKQIRGEAEPRAVGSARILARQVARNPGAFAVVLYEEAASMEGVRVIHAFDAP